MSSLEINTCHSLHKAVGSRQQRIIIEAEPEKNCALP
jgi:hypothetical protein